MPMHFEGLDETTRRFMLAEFEAEETSGRAYRARGLSSQGRITCFMVSCGRRSNRARRRRSSPPSGTPLIGIDTRFITKGERESP